MDRHFMEVKVKSLCNVCVQLKQKLAHIIKSPWWRADKVSGLQGWNIKEGSLGNLCMWKTQPAGPQSLEQNIIVNIIVMYH